jgi:Ala-tRNA(Pro) deacylase
MRHCTHRVDAASGIFVESVDKAKYLRVVTFVLMVRRRPQMPGIDRWLEYLDLMQVRYSHSTHARAVTARETAYAERMPAHELAKSVVYFGEEGFGIAVVPADHQVDLFKLERVLGLPGIRLATEGELAQLFPGCEVGAMPPFGEILEMPVTVDTGLATEFIAFTMGTHRDTVRMSFGDFHRIANPKVAPIAANQEVFV